MTCQKEYAKLCEHQKLFFIFYFFLQRTRAWYAQVPYYKELESSKTVFFCYKFMKMVVFDHFHRLYTIEQCSTCALW